MSPAGRLHDDDFHEALAYLDGNLDEERMIQFERRLAAEAELAASFERLAGIDDLARTLAPEEPEASAGSPWKWLALAAALLAIASVAVMLWEPGASPPEIDATAVARSPGAVAYHFSLGLEAAQLPEGLGFRGPDGEEGALAPEAWLALLQETEEARAEAAFESAGAALTAGFFALTFRADRDVWAVALRVDGAGSPARIYPGDVGSPG